jgi:hypothetical protein
VLQRPHPAWILTRWNRLTAGDIASAGERLKPVLTQVRQDLYRLYLLAPPVR